MNRIKIVLLSDDNDCVLKKECDICYEIVNQQNFFNLKCTCKYNLCLDCYDKLLNENCPFCRQVIPQKLIVDPEEWLNYDMHEWITYSRVLRDGREVIYTYHNSDPQPSWRDDDNVCVLRRQRQRKRRKKNKN